jgi:GxxExxY protein
MDPRQERISTADERRSTPMNSNRKRLDEISERVIGCAFAVANTLGAGFLEKVYETALAHELTKAGLAVRQQIAIGVEYDGVTVGTYVADLLVENAVLVEIKAVRALDTNHDAQCLNYLRATGLTVCLLMNFANPRLEIRRRVAGF